MKSIFYVYHLFQRPNEFNTIIRADHLLQQYFVDQYCKDESERLEYLPRKQTALQVANDTSLCEQLRGPGNTNNEVDAVRAGHMLILPSTYVGGD